MDILILEDEVNAYQILKKRVERLLPTANIFEQVKSVVTGIQWFKEHPEPDLIFLDVELADGQCFEIFKHIKIQRPVIFTTAYDAYAIQAFRLNSVDFLLKPIAEKDLENALHKLRDMKKAFSPLTKTTLKELKKNAVSKKRKRFLVSTGEKYFFVKTDDVGYLYAEDGLTFLMTKEKRRHLLPAETMDNLVAELDSDLFFRINRHQIVQLDAIKLVHEYFNRRFKLALLDPLDEHEFIVSRQRRTAFKDWLNGVTSG
ncbi:MAG: LytTR family DNA-binding domain-containing protein [Bacteroidota bacterium]